MSFREQEPEGKYENVYMAIILGFFVFYIFVLPVLQALHIL